MIVSLYEIARGLAACRLAWEGGPQLQYAWSAWPEIVLPWHCLSFTHHHLSIQ